MVDCIVVKDDADELKDSLEYELEDRGDDEADMVGDGGDEGGVVGRWRGRQAVGARADGGAWGRYKHGQDFWKASWERAPESGACA